MKVVKNTQETSLCKTSLEYIGNYREHIRIV